MAEIIDSLAQVQIPQGFENPRWLLAAGAVVLAGAVFDHLETRKDNFLGQGVPMADPEIATLLKRGTESSTRRDKLGHYLAIGVLGLGAVQLAVPYSTSSESRGSITAIVDVSYQADVRDMGGNTSRLNAAVDGVLQAAANNDVPFSIVAAGNSALAVDQLPAHGKNINQTYKKLSADLTPTMRNGESLDQAVVQARGLGGNESNKIVLISANPGDLSAKQPKSADGSSKVYVIVTGAGNGDYSVGNQALKSNSDVVGFQKLFGAANVNSAHSTKDVTNGIDKIVSEQLIKHSRHESDLPIKAAGGLAIGLALLASKRRLSGILPKRRKD